MNDRMTEEQGGTFSSALTSVTGALEYIINDFWKKKIISG